MSLRSQTTTFQQSRASRPARVLCCSPRACASTASKVAPGTLLAKSSRLALTSPQLPQRQLPTSRTAPGFRPVDRSQTRPDFRTSALPVAADAAANLLPLLAVPLSFIAGMMANQAGLGEHLAAAATAANEAAATFVNAAGAFLGDMTTQVVTAASSALQPAAAAAATVTTSSASAVATIATASGSVVASAASGAAGGGWGGPGEWLEAVTIFAAGAGAVGVAAYIGAYAVATVLLIPASILTLAAGAIYGVIWGTIIVSAASTLGAVLAFLLAKSVAQPFVESRLEAYPKARAITSGVSKQGARLVFLLRLSPLVPFNLLNYALGLTEISLGEYTLASWAGMLPGTLAYVYLGSAGKAAISAATSGTFDPVQLLLWGVGAIATLAATSLISSAASQAMEEVKEDQSQRNN